MAHCSKYVPRFKTALTFRGLEFPEEIINMMAKRAKSDSQLDGIICSCLDILEPPYCQKRHCPSHTTYGFCGCSKNLVPGKCKLNLDYLKRQKEKAEKVYQKRLLLIPQNFFPLTKENELKIKSMSDSEFAKAARKLKRNKKE